jgi:hypothetical protein
LADVLHPISRRRIQRVLTEDWAQFLEIVEAPVGDQTEPRWQVYHPSFIDFLRRKAEVPAEHVDLKHAQQHILRHLEALGMTPD